MKLFAYQLLNRRWTLSRPSSAFAKLNPARRRGPPAHADRAAREHTWLRPALAIAFQFIDPSGHRRADCAASVPGLFRGRASATLEAGIRCTNDELHEIAWNQASEIVTRIAISVAMSRSDPPPPLLRLPESISSDRLTVLAHRSRMPAQAAWRGWPRRDISCAGAAVRDTSICRLRRPRFVPAEATWIEAEIDFGRSETIAQLRSSFSSFLQRDVVEGSGLGATRSSPPTRSRTSPRSFGVITASVEPRAATYDEIDVPRELVVLLLALLGGSNEDASDQ